MDEYKMDECQMDEYKMAFIYGKDEKGKFEEGELQYYGKRTDDLLHIVHLLNYANEYYSDYPIFQRLTPRHPKEIVAYFLLKMGHAVFFNTTSYEAKHLKNYGKSGLLFLPDDISDIQTEKITEFLSTIPDYDILINYEVTLNEGLLDSKTYQSADCHTPKELFQRYINSDEKSNITR